MSGRTVVQGNVVLVEHDSRGGLVLERALAGRGWSVNRVSNGRAFAPWEDPDAIVLVLDKDDTDIFDTLARVSALARRPAVVVVTKRSHAHAFDRSVQQSLGIDRVVAWPCRIDDLLTSIDAALAMHEPMRFVS
jgi:DNA-binding response OmpR family regulator